MTSRVRVPSVAAALLAVTVAGSAAAQDPAEADDAAAAGIADLTAEMTDVASSLLESAEGGSITDAL